MSPVMTSLCVVRIAIFMTEELRIGAFGVYREFLDCSEKKMFHATFLCVTPDIYSP